MVIQYLLNNYSHDITDFFFITPTVPTIQTEISTTKQSGSSSIIVPVLVVSPVVLLVAVLLCLICCLVRAKGKGNS